MLCKKITQWPEHLPLFLPNGSVGRLFENENIFAICLLMLVVFHFIFHYYFDSACSNSPPSTTRWFIIIYAKLWRWKIISAAINCYTINKFVLKRFIVISSSAYNIYPFGSNMLTFETSWSSININWRCMKQLW